MHTLLALAQDQARALAAWELYSRALQAQDSRHHEIVSAISLAREAHALDILPAFGFRQRQETTPSSMLERQSKLPRQYTAWTIEHQARSFITRLRREVAALITRLPEADGTLTETVRASDLEHLWETARQNVSLPESMLIAEARALQLAAVLASRTIGVEWAVHPDGESLIRVLPAHPLRLPTTREPLWASYGKGDRATRVECVAWVILPAGDPSTDSSHDEILMASFCGWQKLCKGIWAALMDRKRSQIALPTLAEQYGRLSVVFRPARRLEGKRRYQTFWNAQPLGRSGKAHVVIEALEICQPSIGRPFAHIVGSDSTPDYTRFARQLDAALRLPIRHEWAAELWQQASAAEPSQGRPQLIRPLPAYGCSAYWVQADQDAAWAQIIRKLAGATDSDGTIEQTGERTITRSSIVALAGSPEVTEDDELPLAA